MGQGAQQQLWPGEIMADTGRKGLNVGRQFHLTALKKRSERHVQK